MTQPNNIAVLTILAGRVADRNPRAMLEALHPILARR